MKTTRALALLAAASGARAASLSPVTRVVELLKGLSDKIDEEGKEEESLYNKFVCWGKTTVESKTASNAAAEERISSLKQYVSDIESGRIEFTTERVDLEKEIAQLSSDIETATSLREQEKSDFENAEKEMNQGIAALEEAISVLSEATENEKAAGLLRVKNKAASASGFSARAQQGALLAHAVELGDRILSKGDARFLHHLLMGDVQPINKDWKKLNRKATFKMSYKARSGEIQKTLAKMLETFKTNLDEATKKEEEAQELFDKLMEGKKDQKSKAEEALLTMEKESGARGMTVEQSKEEIGDLEKQVTDDKKYIEDTNKALDEKKAEWKARQELRAQEVEAISKAISILHSDDARDLFKKSLSSQGYFFLQTSEKKAGSQKRSLAAIFELRRAASKAKDDRLLALVQSVIKNTGGAFDEVIAAIDKMIETLKDEEAEELKTKEKCESERAADTKDAQVASRTIDELTDEKDRLEEEIKEIEAEIEAKDKEIKSIQEQLKEAKSNREAEAAAFAVAKTEDEGAIELVAQAHGVLQSFYADNGLMLAQKKQRKQAPAAGEAPPPPPATWDTAEYGGKTGESQGILSILDMIKEDIKKDLDKATTAEDEAIAAYDELKSDLETQITDLESAISDLEGTKGEKEGEVQTAIEERATKKDELKAILQKIKDYEAGCDFILVNFELRTSNRQIELDGLDKAKAILSGAEFSEVQVQSKAKKQLAVRRHQ